MEYIMLLKFIKKFVKYIFALLLFITFIVLGYLFIYGNFHKVDNNVYRSAQLFSFNMPYYVNKYHIKSILDLRGATDSQSYKDEINISKEYNITHYTYSIGTADIQTMKIMNKIVDIIKNSPKPILIHCKSGADRTSLATALYLYSINKDKIAPKAFSLEYLHFPWLGSKTKAMDESFDKYVKQHPHN